MLKIMMNGGKPMTRSMCQCCQSQKRNPKEFCDPLKPYNLFKAIGGFQVHDRLSSKLCKTHRIIIVVVINIAIMMYCCRYMCAVYIYMYACTLCQYVCR